MVGEEYVLFGSTSVDGLVDAIKRAGPDVVISTVVGDTNLAFYRKLAEAGLGPQKVPVISFSIAEDELRQPAGARHGRRLRRVELLPERSTARRTASSSRKFKARYGSDRVTSDVIAAAYNSVWLWAQAVEEAGTDDIAAVLKAIRRQSMNAPEGIISIDATTQHTWRPVYIGRVRGDGQFEIVWSSEKAVRPIPFPTSRSPVEWEAFLDELYRSWDGWANPGRASTSGPDPAERRPGTRRPDAEARSEPPGRADPGDRPPPAARRRRPSRGRAAPARAWPRARCRHRSAGMPLRRDALR